MTTMSEHVGMFLKSVLPFALYYIAVSFASHIKRTHLKVIHKLKGLIAFLPSHQTVYYTFDYSPLKHKFAKLKIIV